MLNNNLIIKTFFLSILILFSHIAYSQLKWENVDSLFQPLPPSIHVYFTDDKIDTGTFRAYYLVADLKDKHLNFTTDTTYKRRLTPSQFYLKNNNPLVVVNGTFFSFQTHQNLNIVIRNGKMVSYTAPIKGSGKDSLKYTYSYKGAIGISKRRKADIAWIKTDSSKRNAMAAQYPVTTNRNLFAVKNVRVYKFGASNELFSKWKMRTAIGGGPVLLQNGEIKVTNNEEKMFGGKAINDKHPRTAMGYTRDNKLIILVAEGRNANATGANLMQLAQIFKDLNCLEALNLDGGGSSCLLINGKETIKVSDKTQRPIPAVFIIHEML